MPNTPYLDADLPVEARVEDLLARMTLTEKAGLFFHTAVAISPSGAPTTEEDPETGHQATTGLVLDRAINHLHIWNGDDPAQVASWHNQVQELAESTRLGIPITVATDPRHGMRSTMFTGLTGSGVSRWPEHTGFGAIGDEHTVQEYGDVVRQELWSMGIRVYLGPMADLFTDPRWSRGFGTFGEDVEVASRLTAAFIRGLRGGAELGPDSVAAVVKHFPGGGPQQYGRDAHDSRFREQIYPGAQQALHLKPFEAAFAAGVTQVMPYYGMPVGTEWDEVGFAFNRPVIQGLLRDRYRFDGIVCTDWFLLEATDVAGHAFGPNGYGLEHLTSKERLRAALDAGVDQLGGDSCTHLLIELVEDGVVPESRIDQSARRLLREKFRLGLFERRRVDGAQARAVVGSPEHRARGLAAQQSALVLLTNEPAQYGQAIPAPPGARVYAEGVSDEFDMAISRYGKRVDEPTAADVILLRVDCPWEPGDGPLGDEFHDGALDFAPDAVERVTALSAVAPTVLVVYLERPAILTPFVGTVVAILGEFGAGDDVILAALFGKEPITGRLPFDLPSSMSAVQASREDVPFDTDAPLFRHGAGLRTVQKAVEGAAGART